MYDTTLVDLPPLELTVLDDTSSSGDFIGRYMLSLLSGHSPWSLLSRGVCQLADLDEERTHRISVELEDGAGTIDLFVTITGTTPLQEATNDGESSTNVVLDVIPSKLTDEEIEHYVRTSLLSTNMDRCFLILSIGILLHPSINEPNLRRW